MVLVVTIHFRSVTELDRGNDIDISKTHKIFVRSLHCIGQKMQGHQIGVHKIFWLVLAFLPPNNLELCYTFLYSSNTLLIKLHTGVPFVFTISFTLNATEGGSP